jgi:hypothetical protein
VKKPRLHTLHFDGESKPISELYRPLGQLAHTVIPVPPVVGFTFPAGQFLQFVDSLLGFVKEESSLL